MATIDRTLPKEDLSPAVTAQRSASMGSRMTYSRLIGALILAGFVVYGVGFGLTSSVISAPTFSRPSPHIRAPWSSEPS
jgi:hypothetical protein